MAPSPETLTRHELAGLSVRVVESTDPGRVGIEGRVAYETTRTLVVEDEAGVEKQVPKGGTVFEFRIDPDGDEGETFVTVDGGVLLSRPARRTENGVDSKWR